MKGGVQTEKGSSASAQGGSGHSVPRCPRSASPLQGFRVAPLGVASG